MFTSYKKKKNGLSVRLGCLLTSSVRLSNIRLAPCYSHKLRLMPRYWVHKVQMCCHKYLFGCFACTLHFLMFLHWYSGFSCVQVAVTFTYTPVCTSACSIAQVLACTPKWCGIYGCARAVWVHRAVEFSVAPKVFLPPYAVIHGSARRNSWVLVQTNVDTMQSVQVSASTVQAQCKISVR